MAARAFGRFVRRVIGSLDETLVLAIVAAKLLAGATNVGPVPHGRIEIARVMPTSAVVAVAPDAPWADVAPTAPIASIAPIAIPHLRGDCLRAREINIEQTAPGESRMTVHVSCPKHGRAGSRAVVVVTTNERTAG